MGRLLQRSGNATSLPYIFLPGNHEVGSCILCKIPESLAPLSRDLVDTPAAVIALANQVSCSQQRFNLHEKAHHSKMPFIIPDRLRTRLMCQQCPCRLSRTSTWRPSSRTGTATAWTMSPPTQTTPCTTLSTSGVSPCQQHETVPFLEQLLHGCTGLVVLCLLCWHTQYILCLHVGFVKPLQAQRSPCPAAVHTIMLNAYGGYLPNNTIDTVSGGQAQFLYGNGGGPAFHDGNYPQ